MSKQIELAERIDEAKTRLEKGERPGDAMATELAGKWSVSVRTAHRYIAYAKDILDGYIQKRETIIQEIRAEAITEEIRNSVLSSLELEAKLCAIIEGKLMAEKIVRTKDGQYERISCLPSHRDIIYAIDKLFRKRGGYDKILRSNENPTVFKFEVADQKSADLIKKAMGLNKPNDDDEIF
ncbi:MAG TPA: hypothetical protein VK783_05085 [Bacteroidia bacterium]|jgi:hypothetical protein|nr:hypothetical protein [Bacteroidia bacterium]